MSKTLFTLLAVLGLTLPATAQDLVITGVYDATLTGGTPKGVELYALADIPDLSVYGVGSANNGGGSDGEEFTFPADAATAGSYIYVATEQPQFNAWFGFDPDYLSGAMSINGDDAIELFQNGVVIDTFGDINVDGNGEPWEYLDSWAYRTSSTGPDGSTFVLGSWTFGGPNVWDGESSNATAASPMPIGTYTAGPITSVTTSAAVGWRLLSAPAALTVDDLAQINLVSGAGGYTTGTDCAVDGITNLFTRYTGDETAPNGGYVAPGAGEALTRGAGFFWYFFGDTPGAGEPSTCSDGTNTSDTRALPITLNDDGTSTRGAFQVTIADADDADGFYMLGNPHANAYDISALSAAGATSGTPIGLQLGVQAWDPDIQDYVVFTADGAGDLSDADTDDVSIWQGFFAERSGADPGEDVRFTYGTGGILSGVTGDGFVGRHGETSPMVSFRVTNGSVTGAAAVVRFEETATLAWDVFDLSKLAPFALDYAQIGPVGESRDGTAVVKAVESLPGGTVSIPTQYAVPLSFTTSEPDGDFTVTWTTAVLPDGWTAVLRDVVSGTTADIATETSLTFAHSASAPAERLVLDVTPLFVAGEDAPTGVALSPLAPNPTAGVARMTLSLAQGESVSVDVYDALGRRVASVLDDAVAGGTPRVLAVPTAGLAPGVYVVRVEGETFAETRRLTVTR